MASPLLSTVFIIFDQYKVHRTFVPWPVPMEVLPATSLLSILFHRNWIDDFNKQDMNNFLISNGALYDEDKAIENSGVEVKDNQP